MLNSQKNELLSLLINLKLKIIQCDIDESLKNVLDRNIGSIEKLLKRIKVSDLN